MYDYYTVELLIFFIKSVQTVVPTEEFIALNERKVCNIETRKTEVNLFSLPNECCSVSRSSLRYEVQSRSTAYQKQFWVQLIFR